MGVGELRESVPGSRAPLPRPGNQTETVQRRVVCSGGEGSRGTGGGMGVGRGAEGLKWFVDRFEDVGVGTLSEAVRV